MIGITLVDALDELAKRFGVFFQMESDGRFSIVYSGGNQIMISTTGTSIQSYLNWVKEELGTKDWGEVTIKFTVCRGQVTDVRKESVETEHKPLIKKT